MPTIKDPNANELKESAIGNPYMFTGRRFEKEPETDPLALQQVRYDEPVFTGSNTDPSALGVTVWQYLATEQTNVSVQFNLVDANEVTESFSVTIQTNEPNGPPQTVFIGDSKEFVDDGGGVVRLYSRDFDNGQTFAVNQGDLVEISLAEGLPDGSRWQAVSGVSGIINKAVYFYRKRFYDSSTGRFLRTDPLGLYGGDLNLYRYAANNPVTRYDPLGTQSLQCILQSISKALKSVLGYIPPEEQDVIIAGVEHAINYNEAIQEAYDSSYGTYGGLDSDQALTDSINAARSSGSTLSGLDEELTKFECDAGEPTYIQLSHRIPSLKDEKNDMSKELTAEIRCPYPDALIRAHLPIFGTASGEDFDRYELAYKSSGSDNADWQTLHTGFQPVVTDFKLDDNLFDTEASIAGNLGTLDTGLTSYAYWTHDGSTIDFDQGDYLIRLRAFDQKGNLAEHTVPFTVGRVITNGWGGEVVSSDSQIKLLVPPRSLPKRIMVFACVPVKIEDVRNVLVNSPQKPQKCWELRPPGTEFLQPITIKLAEQEEPVTWMIWDGQTKRWNRLSQDSSFTSDTVVKLTKLPTARCLIGVFEQSSAVSGTPLYPGLAENPEEARSATSDDLDGWKGLHSKWGAKVKRISEGDRDFIRMTNQQEVGTFAAATGAKTFYPEETPVISFDYRFTPDLRLNLGLVTEDHCYEIALTGETSPYSRAGINLIGKVPGIKADNKWHHAELDLQEYPSLKGAKVEQLVFWNWENQGILKLALGKNSKDAVADISSFKINPATTLLKQSDGFRRKANTPVLWSIGKVDASAGEFCHQADALLNYSLDQPWRRFTRALTEYYPEINIKFTLADENVPKTAALLLNASEFDINSGGRVSVSAKLNDEPTKFVIFDDRATKRHCIPLSGLRIGANTLSLRRIEGGDWIAWDALELVPVSAINPVSLNVTFDEDLLYEKETGDDYVYGHSKAFLERACTQDDPALTIWFYTNKSGIEDGEKFELRIGSRAGGTNVSMGTQVRITLNDKWIGENWFPASAKEVTFPVYGTVLRSGWNKITLRWVAGSEWIVWDRLTLTPKTKIGSARGSEIE
jgi:RHS repeat-associated protein